MPGRWTEARAAPAPPPLPPPVDPGGLGRPQRVPGGSVPDGGASAASGPYVGRFAPSPTGPLHAGSLVAALASWLDARAHGGRWLVRIEDVDRPRCVPGMDTEILRQLAACGLQPDAPPLWQSSRDAAYAAALARLRSAGLAYDCGCSRADIAAALAAQGRGKPRFGELVYPGTCRDGLHGKPARAVRMRTVDAAGQSHCIAWTDRRLGLQCQDVSSAVGDFVLRRADGLWAYQLAVVVDDAAQGITDVVRGEDLADNTPRQILLQRALGLPTPHTLHTPLVLGADGAKLSKGNGAVALDLNDPLAALQAAGRVLGLPALRAASTAEWLEATVAAWAGIIADPQFRSIAP
jgi:glutamyl-Q tRNA(Asp) synthetase